MASERSTDATEEPSDKAPTLGDANSTDAVNHDSGVANSQIMERDARDGSAHNERSTTIESDEKNSMRADESSLVSSARSLLGGFNFGVLPVHEPDSKFAHFLYVGVLVGGFFLILIVKGLLNIPSMVIAVIAAIVIFAYGWITGFILQRHNPVGADRVGDNCYYLGLTYTLASLIASILALQESYDGRALLGNFGIALISTAIGIIMRLVLMQFRTEIDEVEVESRRRLVEASDQFRQQLLSSKADFETYRRTVLLSLEDVKKDLGEFVAARAEEVFAATKDAANQLNDNTAVTSATFAKLNSRLEGLEGFTGQLGDATQQLSARIDRIEMNPRRFEDAIERVSAKIDSAGAAFEKAALEMDRSASAVASFNQLTASLQSSLDSIKRVTSDMDVMSTARAKILQEETNAASRQVRALTELAAAAEADGLKIREATQDVFTAIGSLARAVTDSVNRG